MPTLIADLGRTFIEIDRDDALDTETAVAVAGMFGKSVGWNDVLAHPRTVLLGEAGTGKTAEFELQRERCRSDGTLAFFCRIEDLADYGLERALDPASDWEELLDWRTAEGKAIFLLDSVDEARLHGKNVEVALRALDRELKAARDRATVLISCRVSDWRAHAAGRRLLNVCRRRFYPKRSRDATRTCRRFASSPLRH